MIGLGIDTVEVPRFRLALARTPRIADRMFTEAERAYGARFRDPSRQLAARFAAKEACWKALGVGLGSVDFHDVEVVRAESGAPSLSLRGRAAALAAEQGITRWLVSLTHSDLVAEAVVIAT